MRQQYCPMCQTALGTSLTSCPCGWRMLDPMPRQNVTLPPPIGFVPQVEHDRLMAAARNAALEDAAQMLLRKFRSMGLIEDFAAAIRAMKGAQE